MIKLLARTFMVLLLLLMGLAWWGWDALTRFSRTAAGTGEARLISVEKGQRFSILADRLAEEGLVRDALSFKILARMRGDDRRIRAGEYSLSPDMNPLRILSILKNGKEALHRFTIPEGLRLTEIAERVELAGYGSAQTFLALAEDPETGKPFGITAPTLEGYLFPDTYLLPRRAREEDIIRAMLTAFTRNITASDMKRAAEMGLDRHELVTLASLIEKETGSPEERPLIAAVFLNRLKKGMRLQTDPAVIYGIPDFDGNLTRKHLETPGPYNTYLNAGLPPGPIASPGAAALQSILNPARTDFLYFVARGDGTHEFSRSLKEHNRAVRKYQLGR